MTEDESFEGFVGGGGFGDIVQGDPFVAEEAAAGVGCDAEVEGLAARFMTNVVGQITFSAVGKFRADGFFEDVEVDCSICLRG